MGSSHSRAYMGRGSTIEGACDDLSKQLQTHIHSKARVQMSNPLKETVITSPRALSPRYAGPFVAMAIVNDGKDHNVTLEKDQKSNMYYASVSINKKT